MRESVWERESVRERKWEKECGRCIDDKQETINIRKIAPSNNIGDKRYPTNRNKPIEIQRIEPSEKTLIIQRRQC